MLPELREQLNKLDNEISKLLIKRIEISRRIGNEKVRMGWQSSLDASREKEILKKIAGMSDNQETQQTLKNIYATIMAESKNIQDRIIKQ